MANPFLSKAIAAHQAGNLDQAASLYDQAIKAQRNNADAIALLGLVRQAQGRLDEARTLVNKAAVLDPKAPLFCLYQGQVLLACGDQSGAAAAYRKAIVLAPQRPEGYAGLGQVYLAAGDWDAAIQNLGKTLQMQPQNFEARNALALVYNHQGKNQEALAEFRRVVQDAPHYPEGWLNLCALAQKVEDFETCRIAGKRATELAPNNHAGWYGYGMACNRLALDDEAFMAFDKAKDLKPDHAETWDGYAQVCQVLGKTELAREAFLKAIACDGKAADDDEARPIAENHYSIYQWNLALLELVSGDLKRGFRHYRSRFSRTDEFRRPYHDRPLWQGEPLDGKTILVVNDQGIGDCLMMLRYFPLLKQRGAKCVRLLTRDALVSYLDGWHGIDEIVTSKANPGAFDCYASIFDLPYFFGTTLQTIPAQVPYLPVLPPSPETMLEPTEKMKVGVVWAGAPLHKHDHRRTIPLKIFSRLFDLPHIQFYSLNRDKREGDDALLQTTSVIDLAPRLNSIADGARFAAQMDLIVTCDTATAHMAGGMGKPVWTLVPLFPDWRWLLGREDSPWYPTMRLFRQVTNRDWDEVMTRVRSELEKKQH